MSLGGSTSIWSSAARALPFGWAKSSSRCSPNHPSRRAQAVLAISLTTSYDSCGALAKPLDAKKNRQDSPWTS